MSPSACHHKFLSTFVTFGLLMKLQLYLALSPPISGLSYTFPCCLMLMQLLDVLLTLSSSMINHIPFLCFAPFVPWMGQLIIVSSKLSSSRLSSLHSYWQLTTDFSLVCLHCIIVALVIMLTLSWSWLHSPLQCPFHWLPFCKVGVTILIIMIVISIIGIECFTWTFSLLDSNYLLPLQPFNHYSPLWLWPTCHLFAVPMSSFPSFYWYQYCSSSSTSIILCLKWQ